MKPTARALALAVLLLLGTSPAFAADVTVHVGFGGGLDFSPITASINVGNTVTWIWDAGFHSTTSGTCDALSCTPNTTGEVWDSGTSSTVGHTFARTFSTAGTFHYFCTVHGTMMQGDIVVTTPVELTSFEVQ